MDGGLFGLTEAGVAAGSLTVYFLHRRARNQLRKYRYAGAILGELNDIHDTLNSIIKHEYQSGEERVLPRNVYDGFVTSTNIVYFDDAIQEQLHAIYRKMRWPQRASFTEKTGPHSSRTSFGVSPDWVASMIELVVGAIDEVKRFRNQNKPRIWKAFLKLTNEVVGD